MLAWELGIDYFLEEQEVNKQGIGDQFEWIGFSLRVA